MTRINVGIDPRELPRAALLAEHREMKRIPNQLRSGQLRKQRIESFRLNKGHVLFFTTRMRYLFRRYLIVRNECWRRNYRVMDFESCFAGLLAESNDYRPTTKDRALLRERLVERGHTLRKIVGRNKTL